MKHSIYRTVFVFKMYTHLTADTLQDNQANFGLNSPLPKILGIFQIILIRDG